MKSFLKKVFVITLLIGFVSCSEDELRQYDLQQQKDAVESLNDPYLLSSILKKTSIFYQNMGWGNTRLPGAAQFTVRNFQGGDNTYSGFKSPTDDMYAAMDILKFIDAAIKLSNERGSMTHVGIFTTFRVVLFSFMTDFYGDVYYSQALKGREGILYPEYDTQEEIYNGLLAELDQAKQNIADGTEPVSTIYDLMFTGDKAQWEKFNNSVKLRLLIRGAEVIPNAAAQIAAVAASPLLAADTDLNASIAYVGTSSANSWMGGPNNWSATSGDFERRRPCKTLVDMLASMNDPRALVWFAPVEEPWTSDPAMNGESFETTDPNGFTYISTWEYVDLTNPEIANVQANILDVDKTYVGFIAGMPGDFKNGNGHYNTADGGTFGNFKVSMYSKLFQQNSHALLRAQVLNKSEVHFNLAEAVVNGWITGDANTHYEAGIRASMKRWGVADADITTYLAQSSVILPGDNPGKLAKIAEQKWISNFSLASEAYLDLRRTQLPDIFDNGNLATNPFPFRYRYPGNELGQNKDAYDQGVATLSPAVDDEFSKIWLLQ